MAGRRMSRAVPLALIVTLASLAAPEIGPALASGSCVVKNRTSGAEYTPTTGASLQTAIDDALEGEVLAVRGLCVGSYSIERTITLVGLGTDRYPRATLDADGGPYVLFTSVGDLTLKRLKITGGRGEREAGGIVNGGGGATVLTDTWVTGNRGDNLGGGIHQFSGDLQLFDSRVSRNRSRFGPGGGIYVGGGTLSLHGGSSVDHNFGNLGGGIYNDGLTHVYDSAHVNGNLSFNSGGGIMGGQVTLHQRARVSGNQAGTRTGHTSAGGGIFATTVILLDASTISNNRSYSEGGGVCTDNDFGSVEMSGEARIVGNTAPDGGGICSFGGAVSMSGGTLIADNLARGHGGGIWFLEGSLTMTEGAAITGNEALGHDPEAPDGVGGGVRTCRTTLTGVTPGVNVTANVPTDVAEC